MASVIIFLNTVINKSIYLHDELFFKLFSLQRKENVYSIGTYSAPEATQILVKCNEKIAKSHIFESVSFFYSSTFSGYKDVCRAGNGRRVYQPKERLASNRVGNYDGQSGHQFSIDFPQYFA